MKFKQIKTYIKMGMAAIVVMTGASASAQSLSKYVNDRHSQLLAKQERVEDRIQLKGTTEYANELLEEAEPELDIYTEGWNSGVVNPYSNANVPSNAKIDVSRYCIPHEGRVTSNYGWRPQFGRMHKGIDIGLHTGDTIRAAFDGKVRLTKFNPGGYGFYVIIRHDNGLETVYGHLSRFIVRENQEVKAGDPIALGGSTGRSTGPHLHFETRYMGIAINPAKIFDFNEKTIQSHSFAFSKTEWIKANSATGKRTYAKASSKGKKTKSKYKSSKKRRRR